MEKENQSSEVLSPQEQEKRIDEIESQMSKTGAVFEVIRTDGSEAWYRRLFRRIKNRGRKSASNQ